MQKINILGIGLTDYSLKESLGIVDRYVKYGGLNTILYVTTPMLILAGKEKLHRGYGSDLMRGCGYTSCGENCFGGKDLRGRTAGFSERVSAAVGTGGKEGVSAG